MGRRVGLGTCWTTVHLYYELEAAKSIPFDKVSQAALIPVAYTLGTDFKPAQIPMDQSPPRVEDLFLHLLQGGICPALDYLLLYQTKK